MSEDFSRALWVNIYKQHLHVGADGFVYDGSGSLANLVVSGTLTATASYALLAGEAIYCPNYVTTSSYQIDSQSFDSRINNITGSSLTDSQSFDLRINQKLYTSSFNSFTQSYVSDSSSFLSLIDGKLNTSSFEIYTSSIETTINNIYISQSEYLLTSSYQLDSSSFYTDIVNSYLSQSQYETTASYQIDSASFDSRINNIPTIDTGSFVLTSSYNIDSSSFLELINTKLDTASFDSFSGSYYTDSESFDSRINNITGSSIDTSSLVTKTEFNAYTGSVFAYMIWNIG